MHCLDCWLANRASGYDLGRQLRAPIGFFWRARYSQIYPELAKLEAQGLVKHKVVQQQDLPDKKVYAITPEGHALLSSWVTAPIELSHIRDELVLKAYSLWLADPEAALALFRTHEQQHAKQLEMYEGIRQQMEQQQSEQPQCLLTFPIFGQYATLQRGIGYEREYLAWCRWVISQLEQAIHTTSQP